MPTKPVEFRVDDAVVKELDRQAAARGLNRAQYLRVIVMDALSSQRLEEITAKLEDLERLALSLQRNLRTATGAVMLDLQNVPGKKKVMDADSINGWLDTNLK